MLIYKESRQFENTKDLGHEIFNAWNKISYVKKQYEVITKHLVSAIERNGCAKKH